MSVIKNAESVQLLSGRPWPSLWRESCDFHTLCHSLFAFLSLSLSLVAFLTPLPTFHEWCTLHPSEFNIVLNTNSSSQMRRIYLVSFGSSSCQNGEIEISGSQNIRWNFLLRFAVPLNLNFFGVVVLVGFRLSCICFTRAPFMKINHADMQLVYLENTLDHIKLHELRAGLELPKSLVCFTGFHVNIFACTRQGHSHRGVC